MHGFTNINLMMVVVKELMVLDNFVRLWLILYVSAKIFERLHSWIINHGHGQSTSAVTYPAVVNSEFYDLDYYLLLYFEF